MASALALQLTLGCKFEDIEDEDKDVIKELQTLGALEQDKAGVLKLTNLYRIGKIYLSKDGRGYLESEIKQEVDLLIENDHLDDARHGDIAVAKRIIARKGRASGKVVLIAKRAELYSFGYINSMQNGSFEMLNIKNAAPLNVNFTGYDTQTFKIYDLFKIDAYSDKILTKIGNLNDPKVDEKLSLGLYHREDAFPEECIKEAKAIEPDIDTIDHPERIDLTHLDFCTIDPVTAKDFDDAIYFDVASHTLYVAIADVSHYVPYYSAIDKEAKKRGFTTYLPHKAFPMIPRELSEDICSLKPSVNRLAFVAKMELDKTTLRPLKEEFFEAIIHSKHRFNYDAIDALLQEPKSDDALIKKLLEFIIPLYAITQRLRAARLKQGFDFRSQEIKLTIDDAHLLTQTQVETGTPSHSLIEECMLLANQAAAKRFTGENDGIFRIHEPPQLSKMEELLSELAAIGLYVEEYDDSPSLIRAIQKEAKALNLESEVDEMIIKSLKQASYSATNVGHFGLGFESYSHFTSPIRRYSDLILHRLIKAQLTKDEQEMEYLLRNLQPLCARVSELEREATKAEWDFRDRKFARWAEEQTGQYFEAEVIEVGNYAKALLRAEMQGIVVYIKGNDVALFDTIEVAITEVSIPQATIMATLVRKIASKTTEV